MVNLEAKDNSRKKYFEVEKKNSISRLQIPIGKGLG